MGPGEQLVAFYEIWKFLINFVQSNRKIVPPNQIIGVSALCSWICLWFNLNSKFKIICLYLGSHKAIRPTTGGTAVSIIKQHSACSAFPDQQMTVSCNKSIPFLNLSEIYSLCEYKPLVLGQLFIPYLYFLYFRRIVHIWAPQICE